jgi:hypothetical protein
MVFAHIWNNKSVLPVTSMEHIIEDISEAEGANA